MLCSERATRFLTYGEREEANRVVDGVIGSERELERERERGSFCIPEIGGGVITTVESCKRSHQRNRLSSRRQRGSDDCLCFFVFSLRSGLSDPVKKKKKLPADRILQLLLFSEEI